MSKIVIRNEYPDDFGRVDQINRLVFDGDGEMRLVQNLRTNGDLLLSMVAELGGVVVGHIAYSRGYIEEKLDRIPSVGLGPMAVHPAHQRKGLGSQLVMDSLASLKEMGEAHCFVLGHTWFYPKFGFLPASAFGVDSVYQAGDHFMGQELIERSLKNRSGLFVYSSAFEGM